MAFEIVPAVDLKDNRCVQLQQGNAEKVLVSLSDPVSIAKKWAEMGADLLHVVDLSGAFGGRLYHEELILRIAKAVRPSRVQVGGGIRSKEMAVNLLEKGIDRVILGTLAYEKPEVVRELAEEYPGRVVVAVDCKNGKVVVKGWKEGTNLTPEKVAKTYEGFDVYLLYTNVDVEGLMKGINVKEVKKVVESTNLPVYVAGGISSMEDILSVRDAGARGVIVGSALYTGKLNLRKFKIV